MNLINQKFTPFLFCLIFIILMLNVEQVIAKEQVILTGNIKVSNNNQFLLDQKVLNLSKNVNIIFVDQNGQQLIDLEEIPDNAFARCFLNSKLEVETIEISGRLNTGVNEEVNFLYEFKEPINEFKISHNEQYLAYVNKEKSILKIVDLYTKKTIWQVSGKHIHYDWHPQKNILAYSTSLKENNIINLFDPQTNQIKEVINIKNNFENNFSEYINFLLWHPQGDYLAYTTIKGSLDAHGYGSNIKLINSSGTNKCLPELTNINFFTWSPSGKYITYTKFRENDLMTNQVGIWDIIEQKNIFITESDNNEHSPIFTSDEKNLIYSIQKGLTEKIIIYNFTNQNIKELKTELRFINNFNWLNDTTLIYTFGDLPQIKKLDINTGNFKVISEGFSPLTINNKLYFLNHTIDSAKTNLYFYSN